MIHIADLLVVRLSKEEDLALNYSKEESLEQRSNQTGHLLRLLSLIVLAQ